MIEDKELFLEHRKGGSGIRLRGHFISFLKPGDRLDVIIAVPWGKTLVPGSKKGRCHRCGRDISLAPSTQEVMKEYPEVPTWCLYCVTAELEEKEKGDDNGI